MPLNLSSRLLAQYLAPQHALSKFAGFLAQCEQPWLANWLIAKFLQRFPIDLSEALEPELAHYASFNALFTRQLRSDARPLATVANAIVSPADGRVTEFGQLQRDQLIQAKGRTYSVDSLLANNPYAAHQFYDGEYATIYLAPHNYHRVHAPCAGEIREVDYIPGSLFSVNADTAASVPHLFARNERVVLHCAGPYGPFVVVFVGALLVGSIELAAPELNAEIRSRRALRVALSRPVPFTAGAELGYFKMGSTIIMVFGRNAIDWSATLAPNQIIKVGELVGLGRENRPRARLAI